MAFGAINPVLNFGISDYSISFSYNIHVYNISTIIILKNYTIVGVSVSDPSAEVCSTACPYVRVSIYTLICPVECNVCAWK